MRVEIRDWNGVVGIVELRGGVAVADDEAAKFLDHVVIVGRDYKGARRRLFPDDGEDYLKALEHNLRGTYLWATSPMD